MTKAISRRFFLTSTGAAALVATSACAEAPDRSLRPVARAAAPAGGAASTARPVARSAEALIAEARLGGSVAYAVADVKTGQMLESRQADAALPPASVAKAITALYALDRLGAGYRFQTRIIATGPLVNGVVQGDLILAGGGDPTLDTDGLAALAAQMKSAGLRGVTGRFLVWGGALPYAREIDANQPDHVGYNPAVSGLALNYNRVHFEWKRAGTGYGVTMEARSDRFRPEVRVARMAVVSRDLPVYTYQDKGGADHWTVAQTALGKGGSRWLPVRRPALYTAEVLRVFARSHGIVLPEEREVQALPGGGTVLARRDSAPLREILADMLRFSTNLTAEMVGMAATQAGGPAPASLRASAAAMNGWAAQALGMQGIAFVDHSGLGEASRTDAAALTRAMLAAHRDRRLRPILKPIALRDAKGRVIKDHPIKVDAKTGTLNFVSTLSGYMTARDGTELAFTILTADLATRRAIPKSEREAPKGAAAWNKRAKMLQQGLIERWGAVYGA